MSKYKRRGAPRYLLSTNEAALPGAAFIVFTGKPGVVATVTTHPSRSAARDYINSLSADTIYAVTHSVLGKESTVLGGSGSIGEVPDSTVIEIVHIINPSQDLHRDKLIRIVEKMSDWYYRTQVKGLISEDNDES